MWNKLNSGNSAMGIEPFKFIFDKEKPVVAVCPYVNIGNSIPHDFNYYIDSPVASKKYGEVLYITSNGAYVKVYDDRENKVKKTIRLPIKFADAQDYDGGLYVTEDGTYVRYFARPADDIDNRMYIRDYKLDANKGTLTLVSNSKLKNPYRLATLSNRLFLYQNNYIGLYSNHRGDDYNIAKWDAKTGEITSLQKINEFGNYGMNFEPVGVVDNKFYYMLVQFGPEYGRYPFVIYEMDSQFTIKEILRSTVCSYNTLDKEIPFDHMIDFKSKKCLLMFEEVEVSEYNHSYSGMISFDIKNLTITKKSVDYKSLWLAGNTESIPEMKKTRAFYKASDSTYIKWRAYEKANTDEQPFFILDGGMILGGK